MRENNAYANKTWKYTYDKAGNITGKYVYAYTTGTLPSTYQDHISYGYSAGAWGDLLTNYNGTTISYDAIGNLTNWRNGILLFPFRSATPRRPCLRAKNAQKTVWR